MSGERALRPVLAPGERERLIRRGVELFNAGEFYACHDAWERVWRSTTPEPRDLWRGLIQVAVGFFHYFTRRRPDVSQRVLRKGVGRVRPLTTYEGLRLELLVSEVDAWVAALEAGEPPPAVPRILQS